MTDRAPQPNAQLDPIEPGMLLESRQVLEKEFRKAHKKAEELDKNLRRHELDWATAVLEKDSWRAKLHSYDVITQRKAANSFLEFEDEQKRKKTMGNIADTSIFQEMQEEMEDWFEYMDSIISKDEDEVDVITDHLDEIEQLEMEAELSVGI